MKENQSIFLFVTRIRETTASLSFQKYEKVMCDVAQLVKNISEKHQGIKTNLAGSTSTKTFRTAQLTAQKMMVWIWFTSDYQNKDFFFLKELNKSINDSWQPHPCKRCWQSRLRKSGFHLTVFALWVLAEVSVAAFNFPVLKPSQESPRIFRPFETLSNFQFDDMQRFRHLLSEHRLQS